MKKTEKEVESMDYEQAARELEAVVEALEGEQPSLEETLALYERGQKLAKRCGDLLDLAELRVKKLKPDEMDEK